MTNAANEKNKTFDDIRRDYITARANERIKLVNILREEEYNVKTGGTAGSGIINYKGGKKLNPPHDLRHHKWIDAQKDGVNFLISLNPYEVDKNSGNPHHLYDRIGVQAYLGDNNETDIRTAMIITEWSLPITEDVKKGILKFLRKLGKMLIYWQTS